MVSRKIKISFVVKSLHHTCADNEELLRVLVNKQYSVTKQLKGVSSILRCRPRAVKAVLASPLPQHVIYCDVLGATPSWWRCFPKQIEAGRNSLLVARLLVEPLLLSGLEDFVIGAHVANAYRLVWRSMVTIHTRFLLKAAWRFSPCRRVLISKNFCNCDYHCSFHWHLTELCGCL